MKIKVLKKFYGVFISPNDNNGKKTPFISECYATRITESCPYKTNDYENGSFFIPYKSKLFRTKIESEKYHKILVKNMLDSKRLQVTQLQEEINDLKQLQDAL